MGWPSYWTDQEATSLLEWPSLSEAMGLSYWTDQKAKSALVLKERALLDLQETAASKLKETAASKLKKKADLEVEEAASKLKDGSIECLDGSVVCNLITLFKSYEVEFLVSGNGHKVDISELVGKDVGLYFYSPSTSDFVLRELSYLYSELRKQRKNFELVFICGHRKVPKPIERITLHFIIQREEMVEKKFQDFFNGRTWLALPFSQRESIEMLESWSNLLRDTFEPAELVIIRPGENIAHAYAMEIFRECGIEAYPFSKSKLTELQVARLKSCTLESLKIPDSNLFGKKVILFLHPCHVDKLVYKRVSAWYHEMKQKGEEIQMIRGCYKFDHAGKMPREEDEEAGYEKIPCLELPYDENRFSEMNAILKYTGMKEKMDKDIPMFVAFGQDGRFITMTSLEKSFYDGKDNNCQTPDFFDDGGLYRLVSYYIAIEKRWRTLDEDGYIHDPDDDDHGFWKAHESEGNVECVIETMNKFLSL